MINKPKRVQYHASHAVSSYRGSLLERITPIAWVGLGVAGFMSLACMAVGVQLLLNAFSSSPTLSERYADPGMLGTGAVARPIAQALPAQAAAVTRVPKPTRAPLKTVAPPERDAAADAAADMAQPAAARPALQSGNPASPAAELAGAMAAIDWEMPVDAAGSRPAPSYVQEIEQHLGQYYASLRSMPAHVYLMEREPILDTYFMGAAREDMRVLERSRTSYDLVKSGTVKVQVLRVYGARRAALVKVVQNGVVADAQDVATGAITVHDVVMPDTVRLMRAQYDAATGRWKFAEDMDKPATAPVTPAPASNPQ